MSKLVLESFNGYGPWKHASLYGPWKYGCLNNHDTWKEDKDVLKEDKELDNEWVKFVKEMDKVTINERLDKIENEIVDINKSIKLIVLMMQHPKTWPDYLEISEKLNSIQNKLSNIKADQIWEKFQKERNL